MHTILAHEQSFPYVLNDASQKVPFRTQHISPETAVATETHRKIYFIIFLALQEVVWVFLATSERWEHACEHLEPQIFLIA